jgi:hypothetical protein
MPGLRCRRGEKDRWEEARHKGRQLEPCQGASKGDIFTLVRAQFCGHVNIKRERGEAGMLSNDKTKLWGGL